MKPSFCYWSVVDGEYATMMQSAIDSARQVGVAEDFHIWTDRHINDAICHEAGQFDKAYYRFKLEFLRNPVKSLKYDYYVWLDADNFFVRHPGDLLRVLHGSPIHVTLESDLCSSENKRPDWWGCPNEKFVELMRMAGVHARSIFEVNAGFFIVHRDVIDTLYNLMHDFSELCLSQGYMFTEEPLLAYGMQMFCGDYSKHTLKETGDVWASDWTGHFADRLPDGQPWHFIDYFTDKKIPVNPSIVHAMRSKRALVEHSMHLTAV